MIKYYVSLGTSILCNCASLILLKKGLSTMPDFAEKIGKLSSWIELLTSGYVMAGILLFGISFITWVISLTKIDLSLAYPTVSSTYIIVAIAGYYLFNEQVSVWRWAGIGLIMAGIIVMYRK